MPTPHHHAKLSSKSISTPYAGPVAAIPAALNPAAHNGVTQIDFCLCGAERRVNINGDQTERGPWIGGDPNYKRDAAAVALGSKPKAMTDKRRQALTANAKKPRGLRAPRIERVDSKRTFPLDDNGRCALIGKSAMVRWVFRCLTPGNRVSWLVRWYFNDELVKVINSNKKPVLDFDNEEREAELIYREWQEARPKEGHFHE